MRPRATRSTRTVTIFPYTSLFRSCRGGGGDDDGLAGDLGQHPVNESCVAQGKRVGLAGTNADQPTVIHVRAPVRLIRNGIPAIDADEPKPRDDLDGQDRKSTRLNSSH